MSQDVPIEVVIDKEKLFRQIVYFVGKTWCDNKIEEVEQQMILDQQEALNNIRRPRSVAG